MHTYKHSENSQASRTQANRQNNRKLVDNFSPESDVTSLQDLFTSRPLKLPFHFIIVSHINDEEASSSNSMQNSRYLLDS